MMGVNRAIHSKRKRKHGTYTQNDAGGPTRAIYGGRAPGRRRAKRIKYSPGRGLPKRRVGESVQAYIRRVGNKVSRQSRDRD